jgi:hypothetical protein
MSTFFCLERPRKEESAVETAMALQIWKAAHVSSSLRWDAVAVLIERRAGKAFAGASSFFVLDALKEGSAVMKGSNCLSHLDSSIRQQFPPVSYNNGVDELQPWPVLCRCKLLALLLDRLHLRLILPAHGS